MEEHDEGRTEEDESTTVKENNGDIEPVTPAEEDAGEAAKDAPADHEAAVAGPTSTSSTAASSGSPGVSSRHKKNSSSPGARGGGSWVPPLKKFFSMDTWYGRSGKAAETLEYGKMSLEEKRSHYTCGRDYLTLHAIPTWSDTHKKTPYPEGMNESQYSMDPDLNRKVSLWRGDITRLEIDAIVNAANSSLLGGGGVDGAIHHAASRALRMECKDLGGCSTGDTKISGGHRLPAKHVLHTVGPIDGRQQKLQSCYHRCLELVLQHDIKSVAFSCIATGVYGYPHDAAARVALKITREWLEEHSNKVDRIIFCVFQKVDYNCYSKLLHYYYPVPVKERTVELHVSETRVKKGSARPEEKSKKPPLRSSISVPAPSSTKLKNHTTASAGTPELEKMEVEAETNDSVSETPAVETAVSSSSATAAAPEAVEEEARDDEGVAGGDGGEVRDDEGVAGGDGGEVRDDEGVAGGDGGEVRDDEGVVGGDGGEVRDDEGVAGGDGGEVRDDEGVAGGDGGEVRDNEGVAGGDGGKMDTAGSLTITEGDKDPR